MVFINLTQNWHLDLMFVSTDRKSGKSAFLEVGFQIECSLLIGQDKNPNHFENPFEEKARNREDREQGRKKNDSAIKIQKQVRGFICRRRLEKERLSDAKAFMEQNPDWSNLQNKSIFIALRGLLFKYDKAGFLNLIGSSKSSDLIGYENPIEGS